MGACADMPSSHLMVVRHGELARLRAVLADAVIGLPRFVLIEGEPGVGRTTFLRQFLAQPEGASVLSASGEEFETSLRYGVIDQLIRSVEAPVPGPRAMPSDATAPSSEPFAMGAALLDIVCDLNVQTPVVIVVDDAHLADTPSQLALLFALRRLQSERLLAILSVPVESATLLVRGLRNLIASEAGYTLRLPGFCDGEVRELGARLGTRPLSQALVERLCEHTRGNPRHITSLLDEVGVEALDRAGQAPFPVPRSCSILVHDQLATCASDARRLVGAAAVIGTQSDFGLVRRLAALAEPLVALESAIDARLVDYRDRQVSFLHPLVRAAVYHSLGIAERAELHSHAAELLDDEASTLKHRAAAATEEDPKLASALAAFAGNEVSRGNLSGAAMFFMDAAALAPAGEPRERYILDALECHLVRGDLAAAAPLAARLKTLAERARTQYLLGRLAHLGGRPDEAERLLRRAEELLLAAPQPALTAKVATELAAFQIFQFRPVEGSSWAPTTTHARDGAGTTQRPLRDLALALALTGRIPDAVELLSTLPQKIDHADAAGLLLGRSIVGLCSGVLDQADDNASRLVGVTGQLDQPVLRVSALAVAALIEYRRGAWEDAVRCAELGVCVADEADLWFGRSALHAAAVRPLAGLGRWDAAEAHVRLADTGARSPWDRAMAAIARGVLAHARGKHSDVLDAVTRLRALAPASAIDEPGGFWPWQELYIDASVATGHLDDAAQELERFEVLAAARHSLLATITATRLLGSLEMARGRPREADVAFRRALSLGGKLPESFDRAVTHAVYGVFLRRIGKRSAAVAELRAGREGFERLGARPWMETCEREVTASGLTPRKRRTSGHATLTAQERSVATLVAQGKSNRAVAADLVISVNTVEYHLKNIYAKLGIGSRSQLVLRLVVAPDDILA